MMQGDYFQASFYFLKKVVYKVKSSGLDPIFNIFLQSSTWTYNKNKFSKTLSCSSRYMLNFDFLKQGLGLVAPLNFVYNFSKKIYLMLYSIN